MRRGAGDAPPDGGRFGKQDRFGLGKREEAHVDAGPLQELAVSRDEAEREPVVAHDELAGGDDPAVAGGRVGRRGPAASAERQEERNGDGGNEAVRHVGGRFRRSVARSGGVPQGNTSRRRRRLDNAALGLVAEPLTRRPTSSPGVPAVHAEGLNDRPSAAWAGTARRAAFPFGCRSPETIRGAGSGSLHPRIG